VAGPASQSFVSFSLPSDFFLFLSPPPPYTFSVLRLSTSPGYLPSTAPSGSSIHYDVARAVHPSPSMLPTGVAPSSWTPPIFPLRITSPASTRANSYDLVWSAIPLFRDKLPLTVNSPCSFVLRFFPSDLFRRLTFLAPGLLSLLTLTAIAIAFLLPRRQSTVPPRPPPCSYFYGSVPVAPTPPQIRPSFTFHSSVISFPSSNSLMCMLPPATQSLCVSNMTIRLSCDIFKTGDSFDAFFLADKNQDLSFSNPVYK